MALQTGSFSDPKAQRRRFFRMQATKAVLGAVLAFSFFAMVGPPDASELAALSGLMIPAGLAVLALTSVPLAALEQIGLAGFAALIGYLAILTGGVASPLVIWLALVPAEAALTGGRPAVLRAGLIAGLSFVIVVATEAMGHLPPSRITMPLWQVHACSVLAALMQAVLTAVAAQDRQRAADAAAAGRRRHVPLLADNAMDMITRHSSDGRIRFASPSTATLLGRMPEELTGAAMQSMVHPEDLNAVQAALMESSYHGRSGSAEIRLRHRDGHFVWAEIRCRPAQMGMGEPADIVAVTRDISERKSHEYALVEARDAALSASRAKTRFFANMSHELRTPLNAIIGFSEVMTREMFGPLSARYQEYSRLIHESGGHLLDLINSVLDMSKIEAGKFELHEELFDLEETAESAVRFLKIPAERAGVAVKLQVTPSARLVFADRRAVKQILVNLLSNGVKYTPQGGEVKVSARTPGQGLGIEIIVTDSGMGISKADLERLGKPFEQVENAETRAKEGTGLGLALVKALAQMHGGVAMIESVLGEGTSVTVRLPFAAVDAKGDRLMTGKVLPFRAVS